MKRRTLAERLAVAERNQNPAAHSMSRYTAVCLNRAATARREGDRWSHATWLRLAANRRTIEAVS